MITREDVQPLSAAISSAAVVGLALGLWLTLPPYLATPASAETEVVNQIDPNLAQYRKMMADSGIEATPYILSAGYDPAFQAQTVAEPMVAETTTDAPVDAVASEPDPAPTPRPERIAWATPPQPIEAARYVSAAPTPDQPQDDDSSVVSDQQPSR